MKISASIYSHNNGSALEELVRELDELNIDFFHIDCLDDETVFDDIERIRTLSNTPIDLHIITPHPEKYFAPVKEQGIDLVTFQYENLKEEPHFPKNLAEKVGLAITSDTPIDVYEHYREQCNFILLMTTTPGKSGGVFNKGNFRKIRQFRSRFRGVNIHVDGGVNAEVSFILRNMGVYAAVTGSYLMNSKSYGKAIINLKHINSQSHYLVKEFMMERNEVPVLQLTDQLSFIDVLNSIEDYRMGFTMLEDEKGQFAGIISNADVRKGLIQHISNLNTINIEEIINRNPVVVHEEQTVLEMLELVKKLPFPVLYLPVMNSAGEITGSVKFNNLIKGEL